MLAWCVLPLIGAAGAVGRVVLQTVVQTRVASDWPWGTLAVNVLGCLVLGVLAGADVTGEARWLLAVGGCGALTTYSTWALEGWELAEEGRRDLALAYLLGSLAAGLAALGAGWAIGLVF
ncbi:MAG: CrcB family protein [Solirubrobacteraceae bacterium]|nr:CrcB family protein [Solirubrobacteraceae bacterium]